jgi:hypothetical protein
MPNIQIISARNFLTTTCIVLGLCFICIRTNILMPCQFINISISHLSHKVSIDRITLLSSILVERFIIFILSFQICSRDTRFRISTAISRFSTTCNIIIFMITVKSIKLIVIGLLIDPRIISIIKDCIFSL